MRSLSYQVYTTHAEGGIQGDGRVGIDWPAGDLTYSDIHRVIDQLQAIAAVVRGGEGPRSGRLDLESEPDEGVDVKAGFDYECGCWADEEPARALADSIRGSGRYTVSVERSGDSNPEWRVVTRGRHGAVYWWPGDAEDESWADEGKRHRDLAQEKGKRARGLCLRT